MGRKSEKTYSMLKSVVQQLPLMGNNGELRTPESE